MSPSKRLLQTRGHLAILVDPTRLDGQVVLITSGAQGNTPFTDSMSEVKTNNLFAEGIDRATAELLASKGANISINDLTCRISQCHVQREPTVLRNCLMQMRFQYIFRSVRSTETNFPMGLWLKFK